MPMAISPSVQMAAFLAAGMATSVTWTPGVGDPGTVNALVDSEDVTALDGSAMLTSTVMTYLTRDAEIINGDVISIDGTDYTVDGDAMRLDDGALSRVSLILAAP